MKHLTMSVKTVVKEPDGGTIIISTPSLDRMSDRVIPAGGRIDNYMRNPVVQWGHNYDAPWATIGRTLSLNVAPEGLTASFKMRPAANEQDPMNVIRLLWEGDWVRTASIGFVPKAGEGNEAGGVDFTEWELLEWSLVPIPANQDALRLAVRSLDGRPEWLDGWDADDGAARDDMKHVNARSFAVAFETAVAASKPPITLWNGMGVEALSEAVGATVPVVSKRGRVLSAKNEQALREAYDRIGAVLAQLDEQDAGDKPEDKPKAAEPVPQAVVETDNQEEPVTEADLLALFVGVRQFTQAFKEAVT